MADAALEYFDPEPASVGSARRLATAALESWGLGSLVEDVQLCVSELASNALVHGAEPGHGFTVRVSVEDDSVLLEVHDSRSRRDQPQPVIRHPPPSSVSGRGLHIVQTLADSWGVEDRRSAGKVVWSRFKAVR